MIGTHRVTVTPPYLDPVTNRLPDPSMESGVAGAQASANAATVPVTYDTTIVKGGARSLTTIRAATSPSTQLAYMYLAALTATHVCRLPVTEGEVVSWGVWVRASVPWRSNVGMLWRNASSVSISPTYLAGVQPAVQPANTWVWLTCTPPAAPAGTAIACPILQTLTGAGGLIVGGEQTWSDLCLVWSGSTPPAAADYFDGDTPGAYWTGTPHRSASLRPLRAGAGTPIDLSCLVTDVAASHGRGDTTAQPDAGTVTLDLDLTDTTLPVGVEIGADVAIDTTIGATVLPRFRGTVTDMTAGWDDAADETPNAGRMQVQAAGPLATMGSRVVGDAPWPAELDGARVARISALAGFTLDPLTSDPGTVTILARDVDRQPALTLAAEVADTAGGLVWETVTGEVRYADAIHRRGTVAALDLDSCDLLVTPAWSRTLQGLINRVSIGYGPTGEGDQPRVEATNADSITRFGSFDYSTDSQLADQVDAQHLADLILARNAYPVWILAALPVNVADLDPADTTALLDLDVGDLVRLTGMPLIAPGVPSTAHLWVEGWTETLAAGVHEVELVVSGYCRTAPAPTWDNLTPADTWDSMAAVRPLPVGPPGPLTWDAAACLGPPVDLGRWNDAPASTRWSTVPPEVTWDTWPT